MKPNPTLTKVIVESNEGEELNLPASTCILVGLNLGNNKLLFNPVVAGETNHQQMISCLSMMISHMIKNIHMANPDISITDKHRYLNRLLHQIENEAILNLDIPDYKGEVTCLENPYRVHLYDGDEIYETITLDVLLLSILHEEGDHISQHSIARLNNETNNIKTIVRMIVTLLVVIANRLSEINMTSKDKRSLMISQIIAYIKVERTRALFELDK